MSSSKLAVKRLTASDLTFFEVHFNTNNAGNQKAINLNADVFIDVLYPDLPETDVAKSGRVPLNLFIYGPGTASELNLQRKIVKGRTYKNYRLNGEFVRDDPARFRPLTPGDFVVFEFTGNLYPTTARAVFIAKSLAEDAALHNLLDALLGSRKMQRLTFEELAKLIDTAQPSESHPINELTLEAALEDAALGGMWGAQKLRRRRSGNKLSKEQLQKAKERADDIGQRGEQWVNDYLVRLQAQGRIASFEWSSAQNAVSPYDFRVTHNEGSIISLDAKSTLGNFENRIHISLSELYEMKTSKARYDIYRVFNMGATSAQLCIAEDVRAFAISVLAVLESLPQGVMADGVSVTLSPAPEGLRFSEPVLIEPVNDLPED